ncbi:hypothetical protein IMCC3088_903 [Aequoribacter fuscus]|uniref:Uncharacterized protein n=1 Tax=Aequoribacter fuscus TaxID=2518989 RepID=F3L0I2_9GAMM|nr:nuclear transport factor 2 family protein [Aequoribacter fuscus]EGG30200.1 hypothetical protein IMCC3088_903 [Aequoribacter fuscus]QHJ88937.1 nuclear transport factor 2 family protein [Aequoribacter fuscus]
MPTTNPVAIVRDLADIYARGADRLDKDLWRQALAENCLIDGPGFYNEGLDGCLELIDTLEKIFLRTRHNVMNVTAQREGAEIVAETYCIADHIQILDGEKKILSWHIRYQDRLSKNSGRWQFTRRHLIIDWEEIRTLSRDDVTA